MSSRSPAPASWSRLAILVLCGLLPVASPAATPDPAAALDQEVAAAESNLRDGEREAAESHYRAALLEGWLLRGELEAAAGRLAEAEQAFRQASTAAVETRRALRFLALVRLQRGDAAEAVEILTRVVGRNPKDQESRMLLVQALVARGQPEQAVQALEEAQAAAPDDLELVYQLATGYLRLKKPEAAERLFARIEKAQPIPQTHVLVGRAYRDAREYDRARAELRAALAQDPRVRRAHYYLGTLAVLAEGVARVDEAIAEFQQELKLAPEDPLLNLTLGMALVEVRRNEEALPCLERAARAQPPQTNAFHYLGRCQLALERTVEGVASLRRALELAQGQGASDMQLKGIHYELAVALRKQGATEDAATHFAAAERYSAEGADNARDRLARYLAGGLDPEPRGPLAPPVVEGALVALGSAERQALERRAATALARSYLNLGILQAQGERFARAAELFEKAAEIDPAFPQVQYSLGVARFNAGQFDKACGPLAVALAAKPDDAGVRRMLAMARLDTEAYAEAAELLESDPAREGDPSLQYAYGLALVRSGRAAEAQAIFARLLARHGDSAELSVVIGQAYAQQGDYDSAIAALERALTLKADVAEAQGALGVIYLKQGRLAEAEAALRAELRGHPKDVKSSHNLATVLDLEGRPGEALPLLKGVLEAKPEFADARYMLGKILLAQGAAAEAVEQLEAAARLAPEEANIRYQLAQAYQKLGRAEQAQQQFEVFRQLKEKRRGSAP